MRVVYLDGVRGVLALIVAASHAYGLLGGWNESRPFIGSGLAVTYFFIMSGFVLSISLSSRPTSFHGFFWSRFWRLWPLQVLCLIVMVLVYAFHAKVGRFVPSEEYLQPFTILMNSLFLTNIGIPDIPTINGPAWSIGIEFWVSAFVLYGVFKVSSSWAAALAFILFSFIISIAQLTASANILPFLNGGVLVAIACMSLGVVMFKLPSPLKVVTQKIPLKLWKIISIVSLIVSLHGLYFGLYNDWRDIIYIFSFIVFLIPATFAVSNPLLYNVLSSTPLTFLGHISFSLYLIHWPILMFLVGYYKYFPGGVTVAVAISLSICVAVATFLKFKFEDPIARAIKTYRLQKTAAA